MRPELMESIVTRKRRIVMAAQKHRQEPLIALNERWLGRRNRSRPPNWERFNGMLRAFPLIPAKIVHSVM